MNRASIVQTPVAREVADSRRQGRLTLEQLAGRGEGASTGFQKRFLPEDGDKHLAVSAFNSSI